MKLSEIIQELSLETEVLPNPKAEIKTAYTSDLMSDVLGNAQDLEEFILITIQAHTNTVAVCSMLDASAVLICNDRKIGNEMKEAAEKHEIAILKTKLNQFEISGRLFQLLKK